MQQAARKVVFVGTRTSVAHVTDRKMENFEIDKREPA